jgi:hypothetical protein
MNPSIPGPTRAKARMTSHAVAACAPIPALMAAGLFVLSSGCEQRPASGPSDTDRPPPAAEEPADASAPSTPTPSREIEQIGGDEPPLGLPPPKEPVDHRRPSMPPPEKTIPEKIPPSELRPH